MITESAQSGLNALAASDWSAPASAAVANLRAVCALKLLLVGYLVGTVTMQTDADGRQVAHVGADLSAVTGERAEMARSLLAPSVAYAMGAGLRAPVEDDFQTGGASDTGLWPIPIIIAAIVVGGSVTAWVAHEAADVVKFFKNANDQKDALQKADAAATEVISKHVQAEQTEGKALEFSEAEKLALGLARKRADDMVEQMKKRDTDSSGFPWYVWAGGGAAALLAMLMLSQRGGVTVVSPSAKAA